MCKIITLLQKEMFLFGKDFSKKKHFFSVGRSLLYTFYYTLCMFKSILKETCTFSLLFFHLFNDVSYVSY